MRRTLRPSGREAFELHYGELYGKRWAALRASMEAENAPVGLRIRDGGGFGEVDPPEEGMYRIDRASLVPAAALVMRENGIVLDACAAPGGKTLLLAACAPPGARIVANELSADRRRRLRDVLDLHLPAGIRSKVDIWGRDAAAMCRGREEHFDAILLDAPCSSERHVLGSEKAMSEWTAARSANLARRQWALLSSAFIMLKPGGCLVYSTCSISPGENDGVVRRLIGKWGGDVVLDQVLEGEATEFGKILLPDACRGAGPIFLARAFKKA